MYPGSCIQVRVSRFMYPGSCIQVHVSRFMCPGSCIQVHVSRFMYPGSCIQVRVSRFMYPGSCIQVHVSRFMYPGSSIQVHGLLNLFCAGSTWPACSYLWSQWMRKIIFIPYSLWLVAGLQGKSGSTQSFQDYLHPTETIHDHWNIEVN